MDKGVIINNIISELEEQGVEKIYSSIPGCIQPYANGMKNSEKGFYLDVISKLKNQVDIYSIETNIDNQVKKKDAERWRLYRIFAKANNGNLFIARTPHSISVIKKSLDKIPGNLKFIHLV